jgi:hypothetical protein
VNIDGILRTLHECQVDYLLIGGVNFLLHHSSPELTFDVDIWVSDEVENLDRLNRALRLLGAEWGPSESEWRPVPETPDWLRQQACFCLTTRLGALDVFREVRGLERQYAVCRAAARHDRTATGIPYTGLADQHMLACQEALDPQDRNLKRIAILRNALAHQQPSP